MIARTVFLFARLRMDFTKFLRYIDVILSVLGRTPARVTKWGYARGEASVTLYRSNVEALR